MNVNQIKTPRIQELTKPKTSHHTTVNETMKVENLNSGSILYYVIM